MLCFRIDSCSCTAFRSSGSAPDFTALTNGSTAPTPSISVPAAIYDTGTVTLTVNGTSVTSVSYGTGSTPDSIAAALAAKGNSLVTLTAAGDELAMTAIGEGTGTDYPYTLTFSGSYPAESFSSPMPSGSLANGASAPVYNWVISSYAPNGDVQAMADSVMGPWTYTYDDFNRLTSGSASAGELPSPMIS